MAIMLSNGATSSASPNFSLLLHNLISAPTCLIHLMEPEFLIGSSMTTTAQFPSDISLQAFKVHLSVIPLSYGGFTNTIDGDFGVPQ